MNFFDINPDDPDPRLRVAKDTSPSRRSRSEWGLERMALAFACAAFIMYATIIGIVLYVAIHFIGKYW